LFLVCQGVFVVLVDTHCHLDFQPLRSRLDAILATARQRGVTRFIVPGVTPEGWPDIVRLAAEHGGVFPAFGLHPAQAHRFDAALLALLAEYASSAVALGEMGLDYAVENGDRRQQAVALRGQLRLAVELGLPVLLHCRAAFQDLLRIVREEGVSRVGGVMHAYSGSLEMAREFCKEGLSISLAGTVTYHGAVKAPRVAAGIPLERLLLETDAPDMAPEPFRGTENEPALLREIAMKVSEIRQISLDELEMATSANAERLFRFDAFLNS
jgi:TatD DNase family protein